jgi:hypothetical protein
MEPHGQSGWFSAQADKVTAFGSLICMNNCASNFKRRGVKVLEVQSSKFKVQSSKFKVQSSRKGEIIS